MTLRVELLGPPRVERPHGDVVEPTGIAAELLGLLLVSSERRISRDHAADQLWPDRAADKNRRNLNTALWRLRSSLEVDVDRGTYVQSLPGGFITFNRSADYVCDVEALEGLATSMRSVTAAEVSDAQLDELRFVAEAYRGDLLEGVMAEWVLPHRDRLSRSYHDCVLKLMQVCRARDLADEAVHWAQRILEDDPLREDVHRALIDVYRETGRRADALKQYDTVRSVLSDELNASPSEETEALYFRVMASGPVAPGSKASQQGLGDVVDLLARIQEQLAEGMGLLANHLRRGHG